MGTRSILLLAALLLAAALPRPGSAEPAGSAARIGSAARPGTLGRPGSVTYRGSFARPVPPSRSSAGKRLIEAENRRARRNLRAANRDAQRSMDRVLERQRGRLEPVASKRRRARAEEDTDELENLIDLGPIEAAFGELGPTTRRVLERSRIELRSGVRRYEVDATLRAQETGTEPTARQRHPFGLADEPAPP